MQTLTNKHENHAGHHAGHNNQAEEEHDHSVCLLEEAREKNAQSSNSNSDAHAGHHAGHGAHAGHGKHGKHTGHGGEGSNLKLAVQATLHCLIGCGIGEIVGVIIGMAIGLGMWQSMLLGVVLGFVFGFALGVIPLIRAGFGVTQSFRMILISEGLSIAVMESAEVAAQVFVPGVMEAGLSSPLFWGGMFIALLAGFIAALPVNIILIGRGIRHHH